jgi:hypothetical protein
MRALHGLLGPGVVLGVLSACGGDATGGAGGTGGSGGSGGSGGGSGGQPAIACEEPAATDVAGVWAANGRLRVSLTPSVGGPVTICPEDQIAEGSLLLLLTMDVDPMDPTKLTNVRPVVCDLQLPVVTALVGMCNPDSPTLVSTEIIAPDSLKAALPTIAAPAVGGSLDAGGAVALEKFAVTVGSTSAPPAVLPSWDTAGQACAGTDVGRTDVCEATCVSDCAAMRDDDSDMAPGVTVHVCGRTPNDVNQGLACNAESPADPGTTIQGKAFLSIRVDPLFTGDAVSSCEIEGQVDTVIDYDIVGGDIYLAGAPLAVTSVIQSLPTFKVDPTQSKFRMVRVDGQYGAPDFMVDPVASPVAACQALIQKQNEIF